MTTISDAIKPSRRRLYLVILALSWAFLHHFCAGIRHLIMDNHIGIEKDSSRQSAVAVFAVSLPLTAVVALKLLGAF